NLMRDRFALLTLAVFLALIILPFLLAVWLAPEGKMFLGSFYNSQDVSVYLSAMRAGARGEWLRTLSFTTETHDHAFYYIFYLALGHLMPPDLISYHVARVLAAIVLGVALWALIRDILPAPIERRIAFVLSLLGMGLGWFVILCGLRGFITPTD